MTQVLGHIITGDRVYTVRNPVDNSGSVFAVNVKVVLGAGARPAAALNSSMMRSIIVAGTLPCPRGLSRSNIAVRSDSF